MGRRRAPQNAILAAFCGKILPWRDELIISPKAGYHVGWPAQQPTGVHGIPYRQKLDQSLKRMGLEARNDIFCHLSSRPEARRLKRR